MRTLPAEGLIKVPKLILRVRQMERSDAPVERILKWIEVMHRDLASS